MMKTKILFVMPSLGSGGAEKSFVSMLPLLSHDEFEIHVMVVKEEGCFIHYSLNKILLMLMRPKT